MEANANQDSVIIIIKYDDKLLLRYNPRWNDISFISGRIEQKDRNEGIRAAHRVLFEELGIIGGIDFELAPLINPPIEFSKKNIQTKVIKMYRFFVFFAYITGGSQEYLNSPNNRWVALARIKPGFQDSLSIPISSLVLSILPFLQLKSRDSFEYEKEKAFIDYEQEIIQSLEDELGAGYLDEIERRILNRKRIKLGLSDLEAKKIEHKVLTSFNSQTSIEIKNFHLIKGAISRETLLKDLQYYARSKRYLKLKIKNVFSEGKTGALVFQVQGKKGNETVSRILKYDFYLRIQKEYKNFIENERLHGIFASPKCEQFIMGQYGFLELQPADDFANAKNMSSLRQFVENKIHEISDNPQTKTHLFDALREILNWLFQKVYKTEGNDFIKRKEPFQNFFDHFLPPRWVLQGKIIKSNTANSDKSYFRVPKKNIISYDVFNNFNTGQTQLTAKVWFTQKGTHFLYRSDVKCTLSPEQMSIIGEGKDWELYVSQGGGDTKRKTFFQGIKAQTEWLWKDYQKYQIYPIFRESKSNSKFDMGFAIDALMQSSNKIYATEFLHGDFNPSNLLFCRSEANKFYPILIDFYDTGIKGSLFYDLARLETEIVISLLTDYLHKVLGVPEDCNSLGNSEIEFILDWEEILFTLDPNVLFTGDYVILELRNIIFELMASHLHNEFREFHWLQNYYLALGVFGIGYQKFSRESELSRYIALIWAARAMYRFDNMESYKEGSFLGKLSPEQFLHLEATPIDKLKARCLRANKLYEIENGSIQINPDLFIDYYSKLKEDMDAFLQQNNRNAFFLIDEGGSGKSWFIHSFFTEEADYPVLFVQGSSTIKDELGFIHQIQIQLNLSNDWVNKINEVDLKESEYSFCIILENFTDNSDSHLTTQALKTLLKQIKDTKIKVIALGEPWFWYDHLDTDELIQHESFKIYQQADKTRFKLYASMEKPSGIHQDLFIQEYFQYYKINGELFGQAINITNNLGYLKQFCEVMEGKNIGKIDNILEFEIMQSYINKKHQEIGQETSLLLEDIERVISHICESMYASNPNQVAISDILDSTRENLPDISYSKLISLIKSSMANKYFVKHNTKISFSFQEVPSFLLAKKHVQEWLEREHSLEDSIQKWITENFSKFEHPHIEILAIYIFRNLYDIPEKDYFQNFLHSLSDNMKSNFVSTLRIISKTIPSLPKLSSPILELLYSFEKKLTSFVKQQEENVEFQEEAKLFQYRMENVDYSKESQSWYRLVETQTLEKTANYISSLSSEQMQHLTSFLATKDSNKGERFLKNFIKPIFPIFIKNIDSYEEFQHQKILDLSRCVLRLYEITSDYQLVSNIYFIINQIASLKVEHSLEALELLTEKKIDDLHTLQLTAKYLHSWIKQYREDRESITNLQQQYLHYHLNHHYYIRNEIDYESYLTLFTLFPDSTKYEKSLLPQDVENRLFEYSNTNLPGTHRFFKIIRTSKQIQKKYTHELNQPIATLEQQHIAQALFKLEDKLLLQYKPKWNDYNWIGNQVPADDNENARQYCLDAIQEKLQLQYGKDFDLRVHKLKLQSFENFSKSRRRVVEYFPSLFITSLTSSYLIDKLLANPNNRFFTIDELLKREDLAIARPVENLLLPISEYWEKIPDVFS